MSATFVSILFITSLRNCTPNSLLCTFTTQFSFSKDYYDDSK